MATLGDLDDIRNGIATNLATISGLRAAANSGQPIVPPMALVQFPETINYDETFGHGHDLLVVPVTVYISSANNRGAAKQLADYLDKTGASSFKVAIEAESTLGGAAGSIRVTRAREAGFIDIDNVTYLTATWDVEIYA